MTAARPGAVVAWLAAVVLAKPLPAQDPPASAPKAQDAAVAELGTPAAGKRLSRTPAVPSGSDATILP